MKEGRACSMPTKVRLGPVVIRPNAKTAKKAGHKARPKSNREVKGGGFPRSIAFNGTDMAVTVVVQVLQSRHAGMTAMRPANRWRCSAGHSAASAACMGFISCISSSTKSRKAETLREVRSSSGKARNTGTSFDSTSGRTRINSGASAAT